VALSNARLFDDPRLKASAPTDPKERGRGDEAPELDALDNEILDRVWDEVGREDGL